MPVDMAGIMTDVAAIIGTFMPIATVTLYIGFAITASAGFWLYKRALKSGR